VHSGSCSAVLSLITSSFSRLSRLGADGKWSDVDYTTGCSAQRANWPAQGHWQRICESSSTCVWRPCLFFSSILIVVMAGAWYGGPANASQWFRDPSLHDSISVAMDWWFDRDFTNLACLDSGGTSKCPCDSNDMTLWNTNWFSNVSSVPASPLLGIGSNCCSPDHPDTQPRLSDLLTLE
jgi:hypothetical protein